MAITLTTSYQRISTISLTYGEVRTYAKYSSQSIANNQTSYQIKTTYYTSQASLSFSRGSITTDGTTKSYGYTTLSRGETTLQELSRTLSHNADGTSPTKTISTSWTATFGGSGSSSGSVVAPRILRQANVSTAPNFNDEQNPTITYTNPAGNNVTSLDACISLTGASSDIAYRPINKTGDLSYTFNLTNEERQLLRSATPENSRKVWFYVRTIIGGTTLYSKLERTFSIVNGNPIFSNFEFEDTNAKTLALTGNNKINVNGYSNIRATIPVSMKATAIKEATMSKYRFTIGNVSKDIAYSDSASTSGTINNTINGTYNVYAIDSRNNSTMVTKLATQEITYTPITIDTSSSVERTNNNVGEYAILKYSGAFWNDNFGLEDNEIVNAKYEFKATDSNEWIEGTTAITPTINEERFTFEGQVSSASADHKFDLDKSYDFRITIEDKISIKVLTLTPMSSARPNLALDRNGVSVMGKYDDSLDTGLQVNGKLYVNGEEVASTNYYNPGDTITSGGGAASGIAMYGSGLITTSTTEVYIKLELPKSLKNITSMTISSGVFIMRGVSGYLDNASSGVNYNAVGWTATCFKSALENQMIIRFKKSSTISNATNNTPVIAEIRNLVLTFN